VPGILAFHDDDPGVLAEFPGELATADIDGEDTQRSVLQEAIREAAGGGAEVDGGEAFGLNAESGEGVFEFMPTATDEAFGGVERDVVVRVGGASGLVGGEAVDADGAGEDEALGFFPAFGEAEVNEGLVEAPGGGWWARVDGRVEGGVGSAVGERSQPPPWAICIWVSR
jgi:hypothetical protein